jgi:curved DNA-binding protein
MAEKDFYQILGVKRDASDKELQKRYRQLARKYHPDVNKNNAEAERNFKEVSGAYDVLSDPKKRKLYDEFGQDSLQAGFDEERARMIRNYGRTNYGNGGSAGAQGGGSPFGASGIRYEGDSADIHEIFGDIFGSDIFARGGAAKKRSRAARRAQQESVQEIKVSFRDAALGKKVEITIGGAGEPKTLKVTIPAGSESGTKIRLPGDKTGFGVDLILKFEVLPDPHFRREGNDVLLDVPVKLSELVDGATITVPTLDSKVNLRVPPNSRAGSVLRLKGRGIHQTDKHGDQLVRLVLAAPDRDGEDLRKISHDLDRFYSRDPRAGLF